jgi:hypothetical protein
MDELIELGRRLIAREIEPRSYRTQAASAIMHVSEADLLAYVAAVTVVGRLLADGAETKKTRRRPESRRRE